MYNIYFSITGTPTTLISKAPLGTVLVMYCTIIIGHASPLQDAPQVQW